MITFRTSTIYEMWLSLGALQDPGHPHQEWAEQVRARLPQDVLEDMESLLSIVTLAFPQGHPYTESRLKTAGYLELLAEPEAYRARMLRLWRRYWGVRFKEESERYHQIWQASVKEKSLALSRQDALGFIRKLTSRFGLPDQIPEGYTTQEIILVPSHFGPRHLMFYGYGSITLIYDC